jgi:hypothetical protein
MEEIKAIIEEARTKTLSGWGYCEIETFSAIRDFEDKLLKTFEEKVDN